MKKIKFLIFFSLILILTQISVADTLNKGDSTESNGRTVTLVGVSDDSVIVSVDGVKNIISLNDEREINGLKIKVTSIFYFDENTGSADLEILGIEGVTIVKPFCGDGNCDDDETKNSCCKDCGCEYGYGCEGNSCVKAECLKDSDCYSSPKDFCSLDKCNPITKKCTHTPITECVVNDKCCPSGCYLPDDPDCTMENPNPTKEKETKDLTLQETKSEEEIINENEKISFISKIINWFKNLFS